jgi:hypothetical protein
LVALALLNVPYVKQFHTDACGAAALEMVCRFLRPSKLSKFNQKKTFKSFQETTPESSRLRIKPEGVVEAARRRGLTGGWGRASPTLSDSKTQLSYFTDTLGIPLIACQRFDDKEPFGHYRVIIGVEHSNVIFHDPFSGPSLTLDMLKFLDLWRIVLPAHNVTGGVSIWISKKDVPSTPLLPDLPNPWESWIWFRDSPTQLPPANKSPL